MIDILTNSKEAEMLIQLMRQFTGMGNMPGYFNLGVILKILFWFGLYKIVKIRAIGTLSVSNLVLMAGALISAISGLIQFLVEFAYNNDGLLELKVQTLFTPLYYFFTYITILCVCYYALHTVNFLPHLMAKSLRYSVLLPMVLLVVSYTFWMKFYHVYSWPIEQFVEMKFTCFAFDWVFHLLYCVYLLFTIVVFNFKFAFPFRGCLYLFLILNFVAHSVRLSMYLQHIPLSSTQGLITENLQLWSVTLLIYHVVKSYTRKLNELDSTAKL